MKVAKRYRRTGIVRIVCKRHWLHQTSPYGHRFRDIDHYIRYMNAICSDRIYFKVNDDYRPSRVTNETR